MRLLDKINEDKLTTICKILFFVAATPLALQTSGVINWDTNSHFYQKIILPYRSYGDKYSLIIAILVLTICYILEILLAYKMYKIGTLKIVNKKELIKKIMLILIVTIVCGISSIKTNPMFFIWLVFVPLSWIIDFDKLVNFIMIIFPIKLLICILFLHTGHIVDATLPNHAHSLGFAYANTTGLLLFFTILLFNYKFGKKRNIIFICISLLSLILQIVTTQCRTSIVLTGAFIIYLIYDLIAQNKEIKIKSYINRMFCFVYKHIALILLVVTVIIGVISFYMERNGYPVDSNFVCRFVHILYYYEKNGVILFGRPDVIVGTFMFDNIFTTISGYFGLIPLALMMCYFGRTNKEVIDNNDIRTAVLFMFYFLYAMMESMMFTSVLGLIYYSYIVIKSKEIEVINK